MFAFFPCCCRRGYAIVGGTFTEAVSQGIGPVPNTTNLAFLNGTTYLTVGSNGLRGAFPSPQVIPTVLSVNYFKKKLWVGTSGAGLWTWDGLNWRQIAFASGHATSNVQELVIDQAKLYAMSSIGSFITTEGRAWTPIFTSTVNAGLTQPEGCDASVFRVMPFYGIRSDAKMCRFINPNWTVVYTGGVLTTPISLWSLGSSTTQELWTIASSGATHQLLKWDGTTFVPQIQFNMITWTTGFAQFRLAGQGGYLIPLGSVTSFNGTTLPSPSFVRWRTGQSTCEILGAASTFARNSVQSAFTDSKGDCYIAGGGTPTGFDIIRVTAGGVAQIMPQVQGGALPQVRCISEFGVEQKKLASSAVGAISPFASL